MNKHDEIAINDYKELRQWFFNTNRISQNERANKLLSKGIYIGTSVRKELLCSIWQNKITMSGKVLKIRFENMTGGVYRAYIDVLPEE